VYYIYAYRRKLQYRKIDTIREFAQFLVDLVESSLREYETLPRIEGSLYFDDPEFKKYFFLLKIKNWSGNIRDLSPYNEVERAMLNLSLGIVQYNIGWYDKGKCLLYVRVDIVNPKVSRYLIKTGANTYASYVFCYNCRLSPDIFQVHFNKFSRSIEELCGKFEIVIVTKSGTKTIKLQENWKIDRRILSYILREI